MKQISVTPDQLKQLEDAMMKNHSATLAMDSDGRTGRLSSHGATVDLAYDSSTQLLSATCTHHPFFANNAQVEDAVVSNIRKALL